jgi:hypothetical protein
MSRYEAALERGVRFLSGRRAPLVRHEPLSWWVCWRLVEDKTAGQSFAPGLDLDVVLP